MLERLSRNFRELLRQFESDSCPLCGVLRFREREQVDRMRGQREPLRALCGTHLEIMLQGITDAASRARRARAAIESVLSSEDRCELCIMLGRSELHLARSIDRLDVKVRFQKALETAPLFCHRHIRAVSGGNLAVNFKHIQRAKLLRLRDALAQAELLNSGDLESLIASTLRYLGAPQQTRQCAAEESPNIAAEEAQEFQEWDHKRQFQRLADLESEAAGLRYRNGVLAEENCRLKLAHTASETLRRDLERDRERLLAEVKAQSERRE